MTKTQTIQNPTPRTEAEEYQAQQMRQRRAEVAHRVRRLRQAAAQGGGQAATRLKIYQLEGAPCPNPDRQVSCMAHIRKNAEVLAQLHAERDDPDLGSIADMVQCLSQREQQFQRLADTANR